MAECMTNCIERQIAATDKQIDGSVYELYGLTGEEIRMIEQSTARQGAGCRRR
jgi:hypothetical protein